MVRRASAFVVAVAAASALLGATAAAEPTIREVDVHDFPLVDVVVSAEDVGGIGSREVSIVENGVPVDVVRVRPIGGSSGDVQVVLAIDVSNSMRGEPLSLAIAAANRFVDQVPSWLSVAVVSFADTTRVVAPMTTDRDALRIAIAGIGSTTTRGTALYDSVVAASELFGGAGQRNVIVLTDGKDTVSSADLDAAARSAVDADVTVFPIGLEASDTAVEPLKVLATRTHGAYAVISQDDLDAAYASLASELTEQYRISYRSKAPHGVPVTLDLAVADLRATTRFVTPAPVRVPGPEGALGGVRGVLASSGGYLIPVAMTFLAAVMLVVVVSNERRDRERRRILADRMSAMPARSETPVGGAANSVIPPQLTRLAERGTAGSAFGGKLARMLARAGWSIRVGDILVATLVAMAVAAFVGAVTFGPIASAIAVPVAGAIPLLIVASAGSRRVAKLQGQLADVCMILASSLRAGHSFLQSLDTVSKEIGEPAASEFNRALAEIRLGRPTEEAMTALADRIQSLDLEWAVTAINIQRKVGGNLAEVLETVAGTIREREMLRRQVRALTSEGRLSARILTVLPFLIAGYLLMVNPKYLANLTETSIGALAIGVAGFLMIVGYFWMRRIVKIDV